jgi:L-lysine exporter family protein LysE/ArgO
MISQENLLLQLSGNNCKKNLPTILISFMISGFLTGFFLGLSLIVAIGAQNTFVLRQGLLREYVFYTALFCAISDSLLITIGIVGISYFLNDLISEFSKLIFGFSALWLFAYGVLRIRSAFRSNSAIIANNSNSTTLLKTLSIASVFTFLNPHVYLDTVILIGSVSQQFIDHAKIYFAIGASSASFIWFFGIAYGAKLLSPMMQKASYWKKFDLLIAFIMFTISFNIAYQGYWL